MGCFLACFGFSKKKKRRKPGNKVAAAGDQVNSGFCSWMCFIVLISVRILNPIWDFYDFVCCRDVGAMYH